MLLETARMASRFEPSRIEEPPQSLRRGFPPLRSPPRQFLAHYSDNRSDPNRPQQRSEGILDAGPKNYPALLLSRRFPDTQPDEKTRWHTAASLAIDGMGLPEGTDHPDAASISD